MQKTIYKSLVAAFTLMASIANAASFEGEDHIFAGLLISGDSPSIKLGAKTIYNNAPHNSQDILDLTAEVLLQTTAKKIPANDDTQAWLAKALGQSGKSRYRSALKKAKQQSRSSKVNKHIKQALDQLSSSRGEQYQPAGSSLGKAKEAVANNIQQSKSKRSIQRFSSITYGNRLKNVFRKLGYPDYSEVVYDKRDNPARKWTRFGPRFITTTNLQVEYDDLGTLRFKREKDSGNDWVVHSITPYTSAVGGGADGRAAGIMQRLSGNGKQVQSAAKSMWGENISDTPALDAIALRIKQSMGEDDDGALIDGLAWLCRIMEQAKNSRYKQFMRHVAKNAESRKLRKWAKRAHKAIPKSGVEQYK